MKKKNRAKTNSSLSRIEIAKKYPRGRGPSLPHPGWIREHAQRLGITQSELAKRAGMRRDTLAKIVMGVRNLHLGEDERLARALDLPLAELRGAIGLKALTPHTIHHVPITGTIDGNLTLRPEFTRSLGTAPPGPPGAGIHCARCQTAGSEHDGLDGALVYYQILGGENRSEKTGAENSARSLGADAIGKPALVQLEGGGDWKLRIVRRGYTAGHFNLATLGGKVLEQNVKITGYCPVLTLAW